MKSIKTKMILVVGLLLLFVCAGFGISSYTTASKALMNNVNVVLPELAKQGATIVGKSLEQQWSSLEVLASNDKIRDPNVPWDEKQKIMQEAVKRTGDINISIADTEGNAKAPNGSVINIKDRSYFQKAVNGERSVSDPIENKATPGTMIMTYAVPIKWNGSIVGVLFEVRDGNDLSIITDKITFGHSGEAYMINKKGTFIANNDKDVVLKMTNVFDDLGKSPELQSMVDVQKIMVQGKVGYGHYNYGGDVQYLGYAPVNNTDWFLAVSTPENDILSGLIGLRNSTFVMAIIFLLISTIGGFFLLRFITRPIITIAEHLEHIAKGDFTKETPASLLKMKDEIGVLAKATNGISINLRGLIRNVAQSAEQVAASAEELTASAEQQAQATNQVAVAIMSVATGTEKQSNAIEETSLVMDHISASLQQVASSSNEVAEQAGSTARVAKDGQQAVDKAVNQMDKISEVTKNVQIAVDKLALGSMKIGEITNVISGIAAQTNLLALNAAIEAARAGEQGRGFSVVAEEVRKLAEQSSEAAKQITDLINNNQMNIDHAVEAMQTGAQNVTTGIEVVKTAGDTFIQITGSINQVVSQIQEVSVTIEEMAGGSQRIVSSITQIDEISKDNIGQTQTVSAATEEQTASAEQIASASQSLAKMAQDLQTEVAKFIV